LNVARDESTTGGRSEAPANSISVDAVLAPVCMQTRRSLAELDGSI
jgi:hypothetical protein